MSFPDRSKKCRPLLAGIRGLLFLACCGLSTAAPAFEVSESTLNRLVEQKLAEANHRKVQLLHPQISLNEGYATFCASAHSKVLSHDVDFCADMTPKWLPESGTLQAGKMVLVSLNAPGFDEQQVSMLKMLLNQVVLPALEKVELYRATDFVGRQISSVKILPGKLDLGFW